MLGAQHLDVLALGLVALRSVPHPFPALLYVEGATCSLQAPFSVRSPMGGTGGDGKAGGEEKPGYSSHPSHPSLPPPASPTASPSCLQFQHCRTGPLWPRFSQGTPAPGSGTHHRLLLSLSPGMEGLLTAPGLALSLVDS